MTLSELKTAVKKALTDQGAEESDIKDLAEAIAEAIADYVDSKVDG